MVTGLVRPVGQGKPRQDEIYCVQASRPVPPSRPQPAHTTMRWSSTCVDQHRGLLGTLVRCRSAAEGFCAAGRVVVSQDEAAARWSSANLTISQWNAGLDKVPLNKMSNRRSRCWASSSSINFLVGAGGPARPAGSRFTCWGLERTGPWLGAPCQAQSTSSLTTAKLARWASPCGPTYLVGRVAHQPMQATRFAQHRSARCRLFSPRCRCGKMATSSVSEGQSAWARSFPGAQRHGSWGIVIPAAVKSSPFNAQRPPVAKGPGRSFLTLLPICQAPDGCRHHPAPSTTSPPPCRGERPAVPAVKQHLLPGLEEGTHFRSRQARLRPAQPRAGAVGQEEPAVRGRRRRRRCHAWACGELPGPGRWRICRRRHPSSTAKPSSSTSITPWLTSRSGLRSS